MRNEIIKPGLIFSFILILSFFSCRSGKEPAVPSPSPGKEEMVELNRYLVQKDREIIENYILRKNLKMNESPGGLWYLIENEGTGNLFKENDKITMNYKCSLLDGTECYSSETLGPKVIVLGRSGIEPGLNEGLRLLRPGSKARFILPPFLAFGFVGDGKKIPPRSIIVYEIEILSER